KHKRIVQVILALITLPFAFFGVDYYFRQSGGADTVAKVGDYKVSQAEFDQALREQQDRMRQTLGRNYDPSIFDTPEARYALVDQLVKQRVRGELILQPLQEPIVNGNIVARASTERYLSLLEQQREVTVATIDPDAFMKSVKVDDAQVKTYYEQNPKAFETPEQAKIEYVMLTPDALAPRIKVDPAEVKAAYDANA